MRHVLRSALELIRERREKVLDLNAQPLLPPRERRKQKLQRDLSKAFETYARTGSDRDLARAQRLERALESF